MTAGHVRPNAGRPLLVRHLDGGLAGDGRVRPAVRPPMAADRAVRKLAELGAYGVNFHDNDVFDFDASAAERDEKIAAFRKALEETGLVVTTATTNLFGHPMFKDGAFTANERVGAPVRAGQGDAQPRPGRRARRQDLRLLGRPGGRRVRCRQGHPGRARPVRRGPQPAVAYVLEQGYDIRFAIEPKPNEPRGDILLPTLGHALAFINALEHPEMVGVNPEVGHEEMAGLNYAHGIAQAMWHGKLFHIDLNGQNGPRYDQDLRFGGGQRARRVLGGGHAAGRRLRRPGALRLQAAAHRGRRGRVGVGRRLHAQLPDPAGEGAGVPRRPGGPGGAGRRPRRRAAEPTLAPGETWRDVRDVTVDADALGARGMALRAPGPASPGAPLRHPLELHAPRTSPTPPTPSSLPPPPSRSPHPSRIPASPHPPPHARIPANRISAEGLAGDSRSNFQRCLLVAGRYRSGRGEIL